MTFKEWIAPYFELKRPFRGKCAFEAFVRACALFDDPQEAFEAVHIGGTNGKGSVAWGVSLGLARDGRKTGLFTSPHLLSFCERIRINGEMISEEDVMRLGPLVLERCKEAGIHIHFFEWSCLLSLIYFREQGIDIGVFEVGIGGTFDPTCVVKPRVCVITSIGEDHMEMLGNSLEMIAQQKAGIIRPGVPIILGPSAWDWIDASRAIIIKREANVIEENCAMIARTLELLGVREEVINEAIQERPPGRFEEVGEGLVLDVAHNPEGFHALAQLMEGNEWEILVSLCNDKDARQCFAPLLQRARCFHLVSFAGPRAQSPFQLLQAVGSVEAVCYDSVESALRALLERSGPRLICGSFYLVGPAIAFLNEQGLRAARSIPKAV